MDKWQEHCTNCVWTIDAYTHNKQWQTIGTYKTMEDAEIALLYIDNASVLYAGVFQHILLG